MKDKYKQMFDSITPARSDDELLRAVLDRKAENNMGEKKKVLRKAVVIPAVAILAVGATTIGVSAAYNWNITDAFNSMFSHRVEDRVSRAEDRGTTTEATDMNSVVGTFDFEKYGKVLDDQFYKGEGFTFSVNGLTASPETAYVMYSIEFDDDFAYGITEEDGWTKWMPRFAMFGIKLDGQFTMLSYRYGSYEINGNRIDGCLQIDLDDTSFEGKTLNLEFESILRNKLDDEGMFVEEQTVPFEFTANIPMDFEVNDNSVEIKTDYEMDLGEYGKAVLSNIKVTAFKVYYTVSTDYENLDLVAETVGSAIYNYGDIECVTLKDGTEIKVDGQCGSYDANKMNVDVTMDYPIEPENVASVTIFGQTFEVG